MMRLIFFCSLAISSSAMAFKSSHLEGFSLKFCNSEHLCLEAQGKLGFVGGSRDSIASEGVTLSFFNSKQKTYQRVRCESFYYKMGAGTIECDNRDLPGGGGFVLDTSLKVVGRYEANDQE